LGRGVRFDTPNPPIFDRRGMFVYYPNNKSGQTSVTGGSAGEDEHGALAGRCIVKKACPWAWRIATWRNWSKALQFTIVRHPYDRFLSAYRWLKREFEIASLDEWFEFVEQRGISVDEHLQPQWQSAFDENECLAVDYLLRLENIDDTWDALRARIDGGPFPILNRTASGRAEQLTERQKQRIVAWYEKDFRLLQYPK